MNAPTLAVGCHVVTATGGRGRVVDRQMRGRTAVVWLVKFTTGEYLWFTDPGKLTIVS